MCKAFLTIFTLKASLLCVSPYVVCQVTFACKTFLTIFTLMLFLLRVKPCDVYCHVALLCETFLTIFTLKGFLFCVNPYVSCQVTFTCETFLTIFTLMGFLFCVNPNVVCQVALLHKTFLTIFTLMIRCPCLSTILNESSERMPSFITLLKIVTLIMTVIIFSSSIRPFPILVPQSMSLQSVPTVKVLFTMNAHKRF